MNSLGAILSSTESIVNKILWKDDLNVTTMFTKLVQALEILNYSKDCTSKSELIKRDKGQLINVKSTLNFMGQYQLSNAN